MPSDKHGRRTSQDWDFLRETAIGAVIGSIVVVLITQDWLLIGMIPGAVLGSLLIVTLLKMLRDWL